LKIQDWIWTAKYDSPLISVSCYSVYAKSNTIFDIPAEAPRPTRLVVLQSFSSLILILDMWFCDLFSISAMQSVG